MTPGRSSVLSNQNAFVEIEIWNIETAGVIPGQFFLDSILGVEEKEIDL